MSLIFPVYLSALSIVFRYVCCFIQIILDHNTVIYFVHNVLPAIFHRLEGKKKRKKIEILNFMDILQPNLKISLYMSKEQLKCNVLKENTK